ncbi:MAG: hypothetical protein AAF125_27645, partial [Chloroflexota bacterium]
MKRQPRERRSETRQSRDRGPATKRSTEVSKPKGFDAVSDKLHHGYELSTDDVMMLQRTVGSQAAHQLITGESVPMTAPAHFLQRDDEPSGGSSSGGLTSSDLKDVISRDARLLSEASELFEGKATAMLQGLARDMDGATLAMGPLKSFERIMEKGVDKSSGSRTETTESGDEREVTTMSLSAASTVARDIKDVLRCTMVFDEFPDLVKGYRQTAETLNGYRRGIVMGIIKMDSWFGEGKETSSGYRDAKIVFQV